MGSQQQKGYYLTWDRLVRLIWRAGEGRPTGRWHLWRSWTTQWKAGTTIYRHLFISCQANLYQKWKGMELSIEDKTCSPRCPVMAATQAAQSIWPCLVAEAPFLSHIYILHLPYSKARFLEAEACGLKKPSLAVGKMTYCCHTHSKT